LFYESGAVVTAIYPISGKINHNTISGLIKTNNLQGQVINIKLSGVVSYS
jgi:hypothetical protein